MPQTYEVTGELTDSQHVQLDAPIPLSAGKVRVIVEKIPSSPKLNLESFEARLRERQTARGHIPRTKEAIDAELNAERDSWGQ